MKKAVLLFLALVMLIGLTIQDSQAVQLCWQLSPFPDIIKVSVFQPDPLLPHKLVNGIWKFDDSYLIPVVGTFEKDLGGVNKRLSLHGTNNFLAGFGGFRDCILDATLSPTSTPKWEGPWALDCGSGGFTNSGDLIRINCLTLVPLSVTPKSTVNNKAAGAN